MYRESPEIRCRFIARLLHTRREGSYCRENVYRNSVHQSTSHWWLVWKFLDNLQAGSTRNRKWWHIDGHDSGILRIWVIWVNRGNARGSKRGMFMGIASGWRGNFYPLLAKVGKDVIEGEGR
jgi:hypothetical protein